MLVFLKLLGSWLIPASKGVVILLTLAFSTIALGSEIFAYSTSNICQGYPSESVNAESLQRLVSDGYFPSRSNGQLKGFLQFVDHWYSNPEKIPPLLNKFEGELPVELDRLSQLVNEIQHLIGLDVSSQARLANVGLQCSEEYSHLIGEGITEKEEQLQFLRDRGLGAICDVFILKVIPLFNKRLKMMRVALAKANEVSNGSALHHPRKWIEPALNMLLPELSQVQKGPLAALSGDEATMIHDNSGVGQTSERAREEYFRYVSSTPILYFFKGRVIAPEELVMAFEVMGNRSKSLQDLPFNDRKIFLMIPYVQKAIAQLPEELRGDYCYLSDFLLAQEKSQVGSFPDYFFEATSLVTLVSLVPGPQQPYVIVVSRIAMGLTSALLIRKSWRDVAVYLEQQKICSLLVAEKYVYFENKTFCDFAELEESANAIQWNIVISAGLSTWSGFSYLRKK